MQQVVRAAGQYVTFYVGGEAYGIDIDYVQEIIRVPGMVKVPLTPPYLEGLANLRGNILVVIDTRVKFGLEKQALSDTSRVIVLDDGVKRLGFIVDRVSEVVNVAGSDIEEVAETGTRAEFLRGIARLAGGERLVLVVDAARLMRSDDVAAADGQAETVLRAARLEERQEEAKEEEVQLVSFRLGAEEYGLEIGAIQEIVHLPAAVNRMPNAPEYVVGVMTLRSRVLPVVSLRTLFQLDAKELDDRARVVVVNLCEERQGRAAATVGLVVDSVAEVLRVSKNVVDPVPALLRSAVGEGICGVCKLAGGKRLVYVLDPHRFLAVEDLIELAGAAEGEGEMEERGYIAREEEEQLVTFRLGNEEFAAGITEVREIIRVPNIVAVPKAPSFVEGVINLRGAIIPVIDLRKRFGMATRSKDEYTRIVVAEMDGLVTGLVVDSVREVLKVPRSSVEAAPRLLAASVDTRFIRGIAKAAGGERLIIVLDLREVLSFTEKKELAEFERHVEGEADPGAGG